MPPSASSPAGSSLRAATENGLEPAILLAGQQHLLELVARGATLHETLNAIACFGEDAIPDMMASVLVFDPDSQTLRKGGDGRKLRPEFMEALDGLRPGPRVGSCGTAAFRSKRVVSYDVTVDPLWEDFRPFAAFHEIRAAWSTPLFDSRGQLLGVLGMYYSDCRLPTEGDLALADHVAHLAAIAIERDRSDAERARLSSTDFLTGLGNRRRLTDLAEKLAHDARSRGKEYSIVIFDVDHFRLHNDLVGDVAADHLIRETAKWIAGALTSAVVLVRYNGDQFAALLQLPLQEAGEAANQVLASTRRAGGEAAGTFTLSAGVAGWVAGVTAFDVATAHTLEALAQAKRLGRDRCFVYHPRDHAGTLQRGAVARLLKQALDDDALEAHYQPIIGLDDARLRGFELLARLRGPERDELMPGVFIPVAEQSNLINLIGTRVLRHAFRALAENRALFAGRTVSVNVSFRQLLRAGMAGETTSMAAEFGVAPDQLVLEVTESEWLDSGTPAPEVLRALKRAGFGLALDDFGTRHAALSHLQTIPFDHVKIDRSFTMQLDETPRGRALCEAVVAMSSAFGMKVTAEGVETEQQAAVLRAIGCQHGQGYLWGRPAPLSNALTLLRGAT